jgi:esterase/lipase
MFGFSIPFVNQYALYRASEIAHFKPEQVSLQNSAKNILQPVIVAHGTADIHIQFAYGKANFDNLASDQKIFLPIKGAVHHNVWQVGGKPYFKKVFSFLSSFHQNKIPIPIHSNPSSLPSDKRTNTKH